MSLPQRNTWPTWYYLHFWPLPEVLIQSHPHVGPGIFQQPHDRSTSAGPPHHAWKVLSQMWCISYFSIAMAKCLTESYESEHSLGLTASGSLSSYGRRSVIGTSLSIVAGAAGRWLSAHFMVNHVAKRIDWKRKYHLKVLNVTSRSAPVTYFHQLGFISKRLHSLLYSPTN